MSIYTLMMRMMGTLGAAEIAAVCAAVVIVTLMASSALVLED